MREYQISSLTCKRIPGAPRNCQQVSLASTFHDNVGGNVHDMIMFSLCGPSVTNYEITLQSTCPQTSSNLVDLERLHQFV